jgi:hypothetical protein
VYPLAPIIATGSIFYSYVYFDKKMAADMRPL